MTMGNKLMMVLAVEYIILSLIFLWERNFSKALYWISAFGITTAVLMMK